jgi:predicted DNA-binding transcriptional regulator AlpA
MASGSLLPRLESVVIDPAWSRNTKLAENGGFELPPAYLHPNTRSCVGQYFAAIQPMFLGVHKSHVSWIPKFPTHESAHDPLRRALPLRITRAVVPDLRNSPVWGNFGDTFLETKISLLQRMQGPLSRQIRNRTFLTVRNWMYTHTPVKEKEMSDKNEQWMKLSDVAAETQIALSTLYYLIKKDRGPKFSRLGRTVRVKRSDFDAWFEENREN